MSDVTELLEAVEDGGPHAAGDLLALVYDDLRRMAARHMGREAPGQTLQATALVHEAWLRLSGSDPVAWRNRRYFFAAASEAMRRILVDRARRRARQRHGGGLRRLDVDELELATGDGEQDERMLLVHEALDALVVVAPDKAEIVKMRFFVGMTAAEIGELLGVTERTVERHWAYARAWLFRHIQGQ